MNPTDKYGNEYVKCDDVGECKSEGIGSSERAYTTFSTMGLGSQAPRMEKIKELAAALWDQIDCISVPPENPHNAMRMVSLSKTNLEEAVMWAVKAISRSGI